MFHYKYWVHFYMLNNSSFASSYELENLKFMSYEVYEFIDRIFGFAVVYNLITFNLFASHTCET